MLTHFKKSNQRNMKKKTEKNRRDKIMKKSILALFTFAMSGLVSQAAGLKVVSLESGLVDFVDVPSLAVSTTAFTDSYYDYRNGKTYLCSEVGGGSSEDWQCTEQVLGYEQISEDWRCPVYVIGYPDYKEDACVKSIVRNCVDRNSGQTKQEYDSQFSHCVSRSQLGGNCRR